MFKIATFLERNLLKSTPIHGRQTGVAVVGQSKLYSTLALPSTNQLHINSISKPIFLQPSKTLYSEACLGLDKLEGVRENIQRVFESGKERYIERIQEYLASGEEKTLFRDDLVNMIGLAELEHLDLVDQFIKSRATTSPEELFSGWGASLMRLYYKYNQVDRAYNNLRDEAFGNFFSQRVSYQIAMTMLYNAGRFEEVVEIYNLSTERLSHDNDRFKTDRRLSVIAFAALSKINTPESLKTAEALYNEDSQNMNMRLRVISSLAYLCVRQNKPTLALNLISDYPGRNYVTLRELKTMSLLSLKRYEDVLIHLRQCLDEVKPGNQCIIQENFDAVESKLNEMDDPVKTDLSQILVELKKNQLVISSSIEDLMYRPIEPRTTTEHNFRQDQNPPRSDFRRKPRSLIK